jgi:hypothetical protein
MVSMPKKIIAVRIEPQLWGAALEATRKRDTTVTAIIEAALEAYIRKPEPVIVYTPKRKPERKILRIAEREKWGEPKSTTVPALLEWLVKVIRLQDKGVNKDLLFCKIEQSIPPETAGARMGQKMAAKYPDKEERPPTMRTMGAAKWVARGARLLFNDAWRAVYTAKQKNFDDIPAPLLYARVGRVNHGKI